jgi:hypothetical protein
MADANLLIQYSNDGGNNWSTVVSGLEVDFGSGSYDWIVPEDNTVSGLIRITDLSNGLVLDTSNSFSIQSFDSITDLIINEAEDPKLIELQNWAMSTSWCSRAIIETFKEFQTVNTFETATTLLIDEYNRAITPETALPNTAYTLYSKIYIFETDELSEQASKSIASTKWSMQIDEKRFGNANVKMEFCTNPGDVDKIWFVWYDTATQGSTLLDNFPNGYLDYSRKEILAYEGDAFGNGILPTNSVQVRLTITTDSEGNGGYINYFALLADPDLF